METALNDVFFWGFLLSLVFNVVFLLALYGAVPSHVAIKLYESIPADVYNNTINRVQEHSKLTANPIDDVLSSTLDAIRKPE